MTDSRSLLGSEESEFGTLPNAGQLDRGVPADVKHHLARGSSALGAAIALERGCGFLANILAARLGGAGTFGAYSLAISTANNISTYAGGGIGSTAARFSGKYPRGSAGYPTLAYVLLIVSLVSAMIAAAGLWLGAAPIAHLLHKPNLTGLLHWTAISAVGIILLECARGFFIGQSRLSALLLLSGVVAGGMIIFIPYAATKHNPVNMIVLQGVITSTAVLTCLVFAGRLGLAQPDTTSARVPLAPMLGEVWSFGFVQLAGLIGINLAGWWLTTLVARGDAMLVQMSFFAIASQLRNIAGLAPSLLTESSYAVMAEKEAGQFDTPQQVMALCTYASTCAAVILAALGMIVLPWAIKLVYGSAYSSAALAVSIALTVAIVHMGNASAAARLSILSVRTLGVINTVWAVLVAVLATVFMLHDGTAWRAMLIYLVAHLLSGVLVLLVLQRKEGLPADMLQVFCLGCAAGLVLCFFSWLRILRPQNTMLSTGIMMMLFIVALSALVKIGRRRGWLPSTKALLRLSNSFRAKAQVTPLRSVAGNRDEY